MGNLETQVVSGIGVMIQRLLKFQMAFTFAVLFVIPTYPQQTDPLKDYRDAVQFGTNEVKRDALQELQRIGSPEAARIAILALTDESEIVRVTAISALVNLPSDEAVRAIIRL